ncbi:beta-barrel assembly-enhancing protease [mine drainage metagenome]|uniref:Beta-barrel assembly-enhancing protease n=1 Tax=mine drainage metagenome TaxID=410659 RepID=A0A1J5Q9A9_9ZZZZ
MAGIELEQRVARLLSHGQARQALDLACAALDVDGGNADLYNLAGSCAFRLGNSAEAERLWKQAAVLNPNMPQVYFNLAMLHDGLGRNGKAEQYYRLALALNPCDAAAWLNLGALLLRASPCDEAEQCFRKSLALPPGNPLAYSNLGLLLDRQQRPDEAEQCHRQAALLDPASVGCRFGLANFLAASSQSGDIEEAKLIFLEVIKAEPAHFGAWNNLGRLLFETGYTSAAHTAFSAAVTYHPHEAAAQVNFASVLLELADLPAAEKHFKIALELDPGLTHAHQGLASVAHRLGHDDESRRHRDLGFKNRALSSMAYRGRGEPLQLLVLASALEGNIPWRLLIDGDVFQTTIVAVEYFDRQWPLPPHQLIFNAIGEADLCQGGLEIARHLTAGTQAPVINRPDAVLQTGRVRNAERLGVLPGVITPRMALVSKTDMISGRALEALEQRQIAFPLLMRAPSHHGGNYFIRVDGREALQSAVDELPGEHLLAMECLDSRSSDGLFRKYRVMSINGGLYPVHMAISTGWKVHYFSSEMDHDENYRNEEKIFLDDFAPFLGAGAMAALEKVSQTLGLDYCGIDFGLDEDGNILLFEANSTMAIIPPAQDSRWDYKRPSIENALAATKAMFIQRALP